MDTMKLILPDESYIGQIRSYRQEFIEQNSSMDGTGPLRRLEDPQEWLSVTRSLMKEETAPKTLVPATQFLFVRESDNRLVGMIQVRHRFNDFLRTYGGHIGYSVRPSERRKGYASQMLAQALPFCRTLGLDRVLVTCIDSNEGSRRTILKNGGIYENTVYLDSEQISLQRYWITL